MQTPFYSHEQLIFPEEFMDEIRVKIGGDHGGGSFKMVYQICNVEKPNSKTNTTAFNVFEAKDYRSNLRLTSLRFIDQVDLLQSMEWRYYIRLYYEAPKTCLTITMKFNNL